MRVRGDSKDKISQVYPATLINLFLIQRILIDFNGYNVKNLNRFF